MTRFNMNSIRSSSYSSSSGSGRRVVEVVAEVLPPILCQETSS